MRKDETFKKKLFNQEDNKDNRTLIENNEEIISRKNLKTCCEIVTQHRYDLT